MADSESVSTGELDRAQEPKDNKTSESGASDDPRLLDSGSDSSSSSSSSAESSSGDSSDDEFYEGCGIGKGTPEPTHAYVTRMVTATPPRYYQPPSDLTPDEVLPITEKLNEWSKNKHTYVPIAIASPEYVMKPNESFADLLYRLRDLDMRYIQETA